MNKNKKYIIIVFVLIILFGFFYFNFYLNKPNKTNESQENLIELNHKLELPLTKEIKVKSPELPLSSESIKEVHVSLIIGNQNYATKIKKGSNVFNVMSQIKEDNKNNFDFKYNEYPYLGIFISEINGVVGSPGAYWIYYVNDKEASAGVSNYIINDGDIISWKQK